MSRSAGPSRVSTCSVAPSAAATIGIVTVQCRSSPWRSKIGCGRCTISRNRSPGGPPPGPVSPSPASWMWVPSSTPAGIRTLIVRRVLTRPSPSHSGHGLRMTVPKPPQPGHGREVITWPRNDLRDLADLAAPVADVAGDRVRARRGALARAGRADDRRVDDQLPGRAERALRQVQVDADGRVAAAPGPAARTARRSSAAEERVHDVAERESGRAEAARGRRRRARTDQRRGRTSGASPGRRAPRTPG